MSPQEAGAGEALEARERSGSRHRHPEVGWLSPSPGGQLLAASTSDLGPRALVEGVLLFQAGLRGLAGQRPQAGLARPHSVPRDFLTSERGFLA